MSMTSWFPISDLSSTFSRPTHMLGKIQKFNQVASVCVFFLSSTRKKAKEKKEDKRQVNIV
jgi:hypothetical protein